MWPVGLAAECCPRKEHNVASAAARRYPQTGVVAICGL